MKKILSIIGFLLLISCSSGDVSQQEKSKSQKQQETLSSASRETKNDLSSSSSVFDSIAIEKMRKRLQKRALADSLALIRKDSLLSVRIKTFKKTATREEIKYVDSLAAITDSTAPVHITSGSEKMAKLLMYMRAQQRLDSILSR